MRDESGEKKVKKPGGMENRKNHTWKPRKAKRSCEVRLQASSWQLELASSLPDVGHSWIHLQPPPPAPTKEPTLVVLLLPQGRGALAPPVQHSQKEEMVAGTANPSVILQRLSLEREALAQARQASGQGAHRLHPPAEAVGDLEDWGCPWLGRGSQRGFLGVGERKRQVVKVSLLSFP